MPSFGILSSTCTQRILNLSCGVLFSHQYPRVLNNHVYKSFEWIKFDQTHFWLDIGVEFRPIAPAQTLLWSASFVHQYLHPWCQSTTICGGSGRGKPAAQILFCQLYHCGLQVVQLFQCRQFILQIPTSLERF